MPAYVLDTLRQGLRLPGPWVLLLLGVAMGWSGLGLAILALGEWDSQAPALIASTAQLTGALVCLWLCARLLDEDARSPLCLAADGTAPGPGGRLLGRGLGAWILGFAVSALVSQTLLWISGAAPLEASVRLQLYGTTFVVMGLVAAWGVLLTTVLRGPGALLAGLLLWALAHLPWGTEGLLAGRAGAAIGILLPGPRPIGPSAAWLAASLAAIGAVALVALAVGGRPPARR